MKNEEIARRYIEPENLKFLDQIDLKQVLLQKIAEVDAQLELLIEAKSLLIKDFYQLKSSFNVVSFYEN